MDKIKLAVPTLIMSVGVSASGKTTFFKELVKLVYDTFLIDKDTINNAFLLKPVINDGSIESYRFSEQVIPKDSNYYHKNVKLQSYHALLKIAKDNLEVGKHPILDAPYVKELRRGYLQEVVNPFFKEINYQTKVIFCYADEEVIRQRMKERNSERDRAKLSSEDSWRKFLEEQPILPPELEGISHVKIDTTQSLEQKLRMVLDYLITSST